jgi:hypothetical protein
LFGDSLIENCEWSELLGVPAANRGSSGEDTTALLAVGPTLGDLHGVGSVFVAAGVNDVRVGFEGEAFAARYRALLNALHSAAPKARITVQSLLPVNPGLDPSFGGCPRRSARPTKRWRGWHRKWVFDTSTFIARSPIRRASWTGVTRRTDCIRTARGIRFGASCCGRSSPAWETEGMQPARVRR